MKSKVYKLAAMALGMPDGRHQRTATGKHRRHHRHLRRRQSRNSAWVVYRFGAGNLSI
jgi:hypothetical protein